MANNDDIGKVFVGGLSWETTKEILHEYFSQYGEVIDSVVMKNNTTGRSRGFGFITFKDPNCVNAVLQAKPHELNGRIIDAKECTPRSMQKDRKVIVQGKVFLGGLPPDVTETDIRSSMSSYGKVTQVTIMSDPDTKKCRGFGFLSFESEDSIDQACARRFVNINGKQVECKRAEPRDSRRVQNGENGEERHPSYGPGFQAGWNQVPQPYTMPVPAYGCYSTYAPGEGPYMGGTIPYNGTTQYQPPTYATYGAGGYGYAQQPAATFAQPGTDPYSQVPTAAYPIPTAAVPDSKEQPVVSAFYGYQQSQTAYGPVKSFATPNQKGTFENGSGYNSISTVGRQGYHPYKR